MIDFCQLSGMSVPVSYILRVREMITGWIHGYSIFPVNHNASIIYVAFKQPSSKRGCDDILDFLRSVSSKIL